ncbi:hypothetical protein M885DRAFT_614920 [Pelagophyceae sp. CCMP2097]|nr:hypothetical protein M885DRAFT_614920 [Pelagophyceae sp. CCMP2097]
MTFLQLLDAARLERSRDAAADYLEHLDAEGWAAVRNVEARALSAFTGARGEHAHSHHALHREYVESLDGQLASFASARGSTLDAVAEQLRGAPECPALVAALSDAADYASWAREMRHASALFSYAVEPHPARAGDEADRGHANLRR